MNAPRLDGDVVERTLQLADGVDPTASFGQVVCTALTGPPRPRLPAERGCPDCGSVNSEAVH